MKIVYKDKEKSKLRRNNASSELFIDWIEYIYYLNKNVDIKLSAHEAFLE